MVLEWLRTWLYAITPSTADRHVQELSLPYDSENDSDTGSVATLETASEQLDRTYSTLEEHSTLSSVKYTRHDHGRAIDTHDRQVIIQGNRWPELIAQYGPNPGALAAPGKVEVFDLNLSFSSPFLYVYQRRVEEFSGAQVKIYDDPPRPYVRCLRLTGTVENAFYAIKAYNSVLDMTTIPNRKVWVILLLEGPQLVATGRMLKEKLSFILPEDGFVPVDRLHITIGLVDPQPRGLTHAKLYRLIKALVDGLNKTDINKEVIGYFNQLGCCRPTRISVLPNSERDPVCIVARSFRKALEDYGFYVSFTNRSHMTVYHSRVVPPSTSFSAETLGTLGIVPDFGPVKIRSVHVSDAVQTLSGTEFVTLAEFPIE